MGETTPVPTTEDTSATDWLPKTAMLHYQLLTKVQRPQLIRKEF